jgi:hypothetical protein
MLKHVLLPAVIYILSREITHDVVSLTIVIYKAILLK